jgi:hypothetical protein
MFLGQAAMAYGAFLLHARAQGTSHAPSLTIREIRAVRLRDGFNSRFIRVYTDQGLTGTGEMLDTVGAEYIVNHNIGPSLAGRDPLDIEGILFDLWGWKHLSTGGSPSPLFMRGMGGPYLTAISGVEMALWDLAGKALSAMQRAFSRYGPRRESAWLSTKMWRRSGQTLNFILCEAYV